MKIHSVTLMLIYGWVAMAGSGLTIAAECLAEGKPVETAFLLSQTDRQVPVDSNAEIEADDDDEEDFPDEENGGLPVSVRVADPLEPWNRAMFVFNDKAYFWVLKPVAQGYKAVMPTFFRECIGNFFNNLKTPVRLANCILQAKAEASVCELGRFLCNTTVGVLGFGNPARKYPKLNPDEEDFGQTLGRYGIGHGIYLVWPLLGPSSLRDTVGFGGDRFLKPLTYLEPWEVALAANVVDKINRTSLVIGDYEAFKDSAFEPYSAARDAYLQYRKGKVEK
ncbi:MAG: VacJ family lipoprotein [Desulfobacterales bacterium]|nr:VacJ family lipoprotein [Desulfobacterales bacterium]